jgi:NADPH:quinone reductase
MKAVLSTIAGGPETLTLGDVPIPPLGPGRVCIANKACSINYPDVLIIQDRYQLRPPRPFTPGTDIAGVVEAIGEGVRSVRVGDRVLALSKFGGLAERVVVDEQRCIKIPQSLPFDIAAALPTTYGTSLYALSHRAQLQSGETLLVLGAAGGVGLAAVELGKAAGARVIAAASSAAKVALARKHGADVGVVYTPGPLDKTQVRALADEFKSACAPNGADVVYDAVGGDYAIPALRAITWEGRYLVVGFPAGIPTVPLNLPLLKSCQILGVLWGGAIERAPHMLAAQLAEIVRLSEHGAIKPLVSECFPLERAGDAIAHLANRRALGKVVVNI